MWQGDNCCIPVRVQQEMSDVHISLVEFLYGVGSLSVNGAEFTEAKPFMPAQLAVLRIVPFTLSSKALVLLKLSEMQSAASTEVSGMDHQSKVVRLQKPLQHRQGAGGPMAYGEAAAASMVRMQSSFWS